MKRHDENDITPAQAYRLARYAVGLVAGCFAGLLALAWHCLGHASAA